MDKIGIKSLILSNTISFFAKSSNTSCKYWTNVNCILGSLFFILIDPTLFDQYFHIGKIVLNKMAELKVFLSKILNS
jgi:hypothetical protein